MEITKDEIWPTKESLCTKTRIQDRDECHAYALVRLEKVVNDIRITEIAKLGLMSYFNSLAPAIMEEFETDEGRLLYEELLTSVKDMLNKYEEDGRGLR